MYLWFIESKLYGTDSVPMMSLGSRLYWCDFPSFFVNWAWHAYRLHSRAGLMGGHRNHFTHTYLQRLILSALSLIFVAGLVGALRGEGSDTIFARESFYLYCTIPIGSGLWKLGLISRKYSVCGHGVERVGISYHYFVSSLNSSEHLLSSRCSFGYMPISFNLSIKFQYNIIILPALLFLIGLLKILFMSRSNITIMYLLPQNYIMGNLPVWSDYIYFDLTRCASYTLWHIQPFTFFGFDL